MTLKELKDETMILLEEYNDGATYTDDVDLRKKLSPAINSVQVELATTIAPIIKTESITKSTADDLEHDLPDDFYQLDELKECGWDIYASTIEFNNEYIGTIKMRYKAYPTRINSDTLDTASLEVDRSAQEIMKWGVAAEILKADPSADYISYENEYTRLKNLLDTRRSDGIVQLVSIPESNSYFPSESE